MTIRERIKTARLAAGISKSELARRVGVHSSSCVQWETDGKSGTTPSVKNLAKVAVVLCVRFEWLATGRGEMLYSARAEETPPSYAHSRDTLSAEERELLAIFRRYKPERRKTIIEFLRKA